MGTIWSWFTPGCKTEKSQIEEWAIEDMKRVDREYERRHRRPQSPNAMRRSDPIPIPPGIYP
jgi:hypothetical protein